MSALTIVEGTQLRHWNIFQASGELKSAVTSTTTQTVSVAIDVTEINGPTATIANFYTMADGVEGQMKLIRYGATGAGGTTASAGDVHIVPTNIAPQSSITFRQPNEYWMGQFINGAWRTIDRTTWEFGQTTTSGAIPLTVDHYRLVRATGTDMVFSLANGHNGQEILITALAGTTVRTVTPTNMNAYTSLNMGGSITRYSLLKMCAGAWTVISGINVETTGTDHNAGVYVT